MRNKTITVDLKTWIPSVLSNTTGGIHPGPLMVIASARQTGKSTYAQVLKSFYDMQPSTKIIWHQLPGRKLKATWTPAARGFEMGLKESDMDPIQQWCKDSNCGKRISFDMFQFTSDKHITMFLLRWSS